MEANINKKASRTAGFGLLMEALIVAPGLYAAFFLPGATIMSSASHAFKGFAKIIAESHGYLAAIPVVAESRFRLLEVDISFGFVGIEDIADGQFEAAFVFEYLFRDGCRSLSQGLDDDLAFYAFGAIEARDFSPPPFGEAELVIEVDEQRSRIHIDVLAIKHATELIVVEIAV